MDESSTHDPAAARARRPRRAPRPPAWRLVVAGAGVDDERLVEYVLEDDVLLVIAAGGRWAEGAVALGRGLVGLVSLYIYQMLIRALLLLLFL